MKVKETPIILPRNYIVWLFFIWLLFKTYRTPEPEYITVLFFVLVAFILCEVYITIIKNSIHIQVLPISKQFNKEEQATLKLIVSNVSFLPVPYVYIFLKESYHVEAEQIKCLCVTLPAQSRKEYTFHLQALNSGKEEIGISKVIVSDYMELVQRRLKFTWKQEVVVLPQPKKLTGSRYILGYAPTQNNEKIDANQSVITEAGEVSYELQPYLEGESQRLMHWKLVAQRDIYMVRQREEIIKLKKQRLVIVDPVIGDALSMTVRLSGFKALSKRSRIRFRWAKGKKQAQIKDKMINGITSYLLDILNAQEAILFLYYENGRWHQCLLVTVQDLEQFSIQISRSILDSEDKPKIRIPEIPDGNYSQKILITAKADTALGAAAEDISGIHILEIADRSVHTLGSYATAWYLTDDYQIVRNG